MDKLEKKDIDGIDKSKNHPAVFSTYETFSVSYNYAVMFMNHCFSGMVGETHDCYRAYLIDCINCNTKEIEYEDLKRLYRYVEGKSDRMEYWNLMNEMSPESRKLSLERTTQEALSIVR